MLKGDFFTFNSSFFASVAVLSPNIFSLGVATPVSMSFE
jgi:hypothetical protein